MKSSNLEKVKYISVLNYIDPNNSKINDIIKYLKNSTFIEARWTVLPNDNYYYNSDNTSSAIFLKALIANKIDEKLLTENLARYILSQKNSNYYFDSEIIQAINDYVNYTKELQNVWFEAKWYLNSKELIKTKFNENNKFDLIKNSYALANTIKIGDKNSLWFEKTWTWKLYYDVLVKYYLPIKNIFARDEGLIVSRVMYNYNDYLTAFKKECYLPYYADARKAVSMDSMTHCTNRQIKEINPILEWSAWDYLVKQIQVTTPINRKNVIVDDFIPAWAEIVNVNIDTTSNQVKDITSTQNNYYWFDNIQNHDEKVELFASNLSAWTYTYTYVIKLNHKWTYNYRPTEARVLDSEEIWWRSKWETFIVK